jgi:hypothetical protein
MAQLVSAFNAQQFDPSQSSGQLPVGRHPVVVDKSEVKATKAGDGGYLELTLKIIDGPQTGTTGAMRLNLYAQSQQASEIAHRQLSAICHAIGQFMINDSAQLHNHPFIVEVSPQKNDPQYTEVKKILDINGNEPGKAPAPQQAIQQPAPQAQFAPAAQQAATFGNPTPSVQPAWGSSPAPEAAPQPAWGQPAQQQMAPSHAPEPQPQAATAWGAPAQQAAPQPAWGQPTQQAAPVWGAPR